MELLFMSLGAAVVVYYGVKLLLFSRMLFPKLWFPLSKSFFTSMGEWAGECCEHTQLCSIVFVHGSGSAITVQLIHPLSLLDSTSCIGETRAAGTCRFICLYWKDTCQNVPVHGRKNQQKNEQFT